MTTVQKLNKQADKLGRPHNGEIGNQWRSLEYSELPSGITKDDLRKAAFSEGITLAEEAPPYTVFFPSRRNALKSVKKQAAKQEAARKAANNAFYGVYAEQN